MADNRKLIDPHLDWGEQAQSIRLEVDQDRARALGLTPQDVAQTLQTLLTGFTVTQYREGIETVDVVARAVPAERLDLARLPDLTISTRNGVAVPLSQIARLNYAYEEPILWRRNRDLVLTVRGDIVDGVQAPDVSNEVAPKLKSIQDAMPYGYRIETGGAIEESEKANASLAVVFPVMAVVMLAILMIQLQSFSRLALVFATAPLGIIGATAALLISNRPFGFVALLGMIALAGMIMRNTVILVDQIDHDIAAGHGRHRAIIDATVRRARPVVLTALAAILGMIPLGAQPVLGADGDHHHGRPVRRDDPHAAGGPGALRAVVPGTGRRACAKRDGRRRSRRRFRYEAHSHQDCRRMKPFKPRTVRIPIREERGFYREPTLDEILSDSIVEAIMQADAVDPDELGVMLGRIARTLRAAEPVTRASA